MTNPRSFNWALVGPGRIAHRFAEAVAGIPGARLQAVVGRDAARAAAFAARWSVPASGSELAAVLDDPALDAVYIATPHAQHGEAIRACLLAGKPVLSEKPLVPHGALGRELVALARARGVFLMEAVWTRFLPAYAQAGAWLRDHERFGRLQSIQSSFCFPAPYEADSRLYDPALAGGALLDIGIYNLSATRWALQQALGHCPEPQALQLHGRLAPSGVDQRIAATQIFPGDISAQFVCGFDGCADNGLRLHGERGTITLPEPFWGATEAWLASGRGEGARTERITAPYRINGFEYEIEEAMRCIRAGLIESPQLPHEETLAVLAWMDEIRARLGVRYPFE
jgi:predicted dehydrogenase